MLDRRHRVLKWQFEDVGEILFEAVRWLCVAWPERIRDTGPDGALIWRMRSPEEVAQYVDALHWCERYLGPAPPTKENHLRAWIETRIHRTCYFKRMARRGVSREDAQARLDRDLKRIARGLNKDGVPVW